MKRNLYLLIAISLIAVMDVNAQGCVAVRHMSTTPNIGASSSIGSKWQLSMGYRYFRSHRHFVGRIYQKHRREAGSEVINIASSLEITPTYSINNRFSVSATVPLIYNDRSSLYEHDRVNRYHTYSKGIGDIRVMGNYWLYNPETNMDNNISLGVGLKLPTGNSNVKDEFHKAGDKIVKESVDQSIQLGDGGLGMVVELQGFRKLFNNAYGYVGGFYLFNPRNTNNTVRSSSGVKLSVADQYMVRGGMNYNIHKIGLIGSFGGRAECIPVRDLLGKTGGFRRPGYIVSLEPGVTYSLKKNIFNLSVPVAVIRNRTKSLADYKSGRHGDAAFSDFVVYATFTRRF